MDQCVPDLAVGLLIRLGLAGDGSAAEATEIIERLRPFEYVNRMHWESWNSVTDALSPESLTALIKGLTLAERDLWWSGGSVSAVIWTYRALERRDPSQARDLVDWILPRTQNYYAPFGSSTHGAKTYVQFLAAEEALAAYRQSRRAEIEQEQRAAGAARARRRTEKAASTILRNTPERDRFLAILTPLPIAEQLRMLAFDNIHAATYYPTQLAAPAKSDVLAALPVEVRQRLWAKLYGRHRGPWGQLKRRLAPLM